MSDNTPVKTDKLKAYGELLNDIPKVTVSAWGNDFGLGLAHRNAVKLAYEIASYYTQEQRDKTLSEILRILYLWKNEYGVYPAYSYNPLSQRRQFIAGILGQDETNKPPIPAREYDLIVIEKKEKGEDIDIPDPWECCPYISTPLGLFDKIWTDNYQPLSSYLSENSHLFPLIRSTLIILSNAITDNHNTDCINAAINLASSNIKIQKNIINYMKPAAIKEFNRKKMQAEKQNAKKRDTERAVLECRQKLLKDGKSFNNKSIHHETGISLPQISRILRENGIKSKK